MNYIIQSSIIISSISILWRSTLNKKHSLGIFLRKNFPIFLGTALTCGLCFTYWTTLFFVLLFNPVPIGFFSFVDTYILRIFFSWMYIGFFAVVFRFLFALLQEGVNYMHQKNNNGKHIH